jgi:two-component system, NtrC family, sensor kinase
VLEDHTAADTIIQRLAADLGSLVMQEEVQTRLLHALLTIFDVEFASLVLVGESPGSPLERRTMYSSGSWQHQAAPHLREGLIYHSLQHGQALWVNDAAASPRFNPEFDAPAAAKVQSLLCIPLISNRTPLGVLQLFNKRSGEFGLADADQGALLASLAAQSISNARLQHQLKTAQEGLRASQDELLRARSTLHALFENTPASIYMIDRQFNLTALNHSAAHRTGQPAPLLVGQCCYAVFYQRNEPCTGCRVHETLQFGRATRRAELHRLGVGDPVEWDIHAYPIFGDADQVEQALLVEQDVTEKRRMESLLAQSEKMAAVGQLAAGVVHEINNPLTAILANAQMLQRELPPDSDLQEAVDLISRAGERAAQVVRTLLDFARKDQYQLMPTSLNETIHRSLALIQHELLARGVSLNFDPAPDLPPVQGSADHLLGVWLNLLLNAMDALEGKPGEVRVTTRQVGREVLVSVADTGKGISSENLARIFEPFYTTKAPGRGTGLGLSVCQRIVHQHGGTLGVESQVGEGSVFTVALPVSRD